MSTTTITLELPRNLYLRLQQTAEATRQSLDAVLMRALQVGSPPTWETAPAEFLQALVHKYPTGTIYVAWDNANQHPPRR